MSGTPLVAFEADELSAFLEYFCLLEEGWRFYREHDNGVELWSFISSQSMMKKKRYHRVGLPYPEYGYPMSALVRRGYKMSIDELSGTIQVVLNCRVVARVYRNRFDVYTSEADQINIQNAVEGN